MARRLALGLPTLLGLARRGWFIPYRYAATLPPAGGLPSYDALAERLRAAEPAMLELIDRIDGLAEALLAIGDAPPPAPRWTQSWFPGLDAAAAYALVRSRRPALILEVGSGHSTRFLARALADAGGEGRLLAIDPAPRAAIAGLKGVEYRRSTLHAAPAELFARLAPGDMLFIDSSHVLMPGSDVDHLLNRVLPRLPSGVLVHFHDIFLPDDYPAHWAWRGYNEQQGVAPLLQGGGYEILFASHHARQRLGNRLGRSVVARLKLPEEALESSLWLRKL
ncbi:MAG: class I SAM-dependent methyltransferase [Alphaproteobacteria bacterium]|nr:class I SAM-dependent methyltransferase [Alphaproteobacteria bacterium]